MDEPLPQQAQRGPYIEHPPEAFVIDQDGFAWVRWPDGSLSMVRSTDANTRTTVVREYRLLGEREASEQ